MGTTRRDFLKEALAALGFSALPGGVLFAAPPGWTHPGEPRLAFGVLSDTHLRTAGGRSARPGRNWPHKYLVSALEYFKSCKVDAVAHCGDFAHRGQVEEMRFHADVWRRVFGGAAPVRLFVAGNHDLAGAGYGDFVAKKYPDRAVRAKHVLATDMPANWLRIWGEPYERVWRKEVKGFTFFGRHWDGTEAELSKLVAATARSAGLDKGLKPFFILSHPRPSSSLLKAVRPYRNAVSFYGHNHWSAASWNIVSLYGGSLPCIHCPSCEPRGCAALVRDGYISKAKIEGRDNGSTGRGRQAYVVRIYDDMMVVGRHEFSNGRAGMGPDWVMPFGRTPHPFSGSEFRKSAGEPQFPEGAKLAVSADDAALHVKIPLADGNPRSRVYAYEVEVSGKPGGGRKIVKSVYAAGCNLGIGREPFKGVTTLSIPRAELPKEGELAVSARPLTSLGTSGEPLKALLGKDDPHENA